MFVVVACEDFDADERDLLLSVWVGADDRNLPVTVLDLSGVTFGDSSFLDSLLLARRRHHAASRRLVLAGPLRHRRAPALRDRHTAALRDRRVPHRRTPRPHPHLSAHV
ncbi:STAS domain-containing protein [Streptomyces rubiginosohelvolus]|uniref:STAS domain-containing protein n=1 Tax=Streptomyces sp. CB02130 TaxID=1703934 RepID=UPI003FD3AD2A